MSHSASHGHAKEEKKEEKALVAVSPKTKALHRVILWTLSIFAVGAIATLYRVWVIKYQDPFSELHNKVDDLAYNKIKAINKKYGKKPDALALQLEANEIRAVEVEKGRTHSEISAPSPKGCPNDLHSDEKGIYFNTFGCGRDQSFVWPQLVDPVEAQVYSVQVYPQDNRIPDPPDVQRFGDRHGNIAEAVSEPYVVISEGRVGRAQDYRLRGEIRYFPHGDSYEVKMLLK